jgi:hypothetical protein
MRDRSRKERFIQFVDTLEESFSRDAKFSQNLLPMVRVVMGIVGLSIV